MASDRDKEFRKAQQRRRWAMKEVGDSVDTGQKWITLREAAERCGCSTRTLRRRMEDDGFPRPIKWFGKRELSASEVDAYMVRKMAEHKNAERAAVKDPIHVAP